MLGHDRATGRVPARRGHASPTSVLGLGALALIALAVADPAEAYIDPGSGSLLLQLILAAFATGLFFVRDSIRRGLARLRGWLGRGSGGGASGPAP